MLEQRDFDTLVIAQCRHWIPFLALFDLLTDLELNCWCHDLQQSTSRRCSNGSCPSSGEGGKVDAFTLVLHNSIQPQELGDWVRPPQARPKEPGRVHLACDLAITLFP
jgi:hypothetical protein